MCWLFGCITLLYACGKNDAIMNIQQKCLQGLDAKNLVIYIESWHFAHGHIETMRFVLL